MTPQEKIKELEKKRDELKKENTKFLEEQEKIKNTEPKIAKQIFKIFDDYGLTLTERKQILKEIIKMAENFKKENMKNK